MCGIHMKISTYLVNTFVQYKVVCKVVRNNLVNTMELQCFPPCYKVVNILCHLNFYSIDVSMLHYNGFYVKSMYVNSFFDILYSGFFEGGIFMNFTNRAPFVKMLSVKNLKFLQQCSN